MESNQNKKGIIKQLFYLVLSLAGLVFFILMSQSVEAATADYQRCKTGENCIIGEFLYDDDFNPIATASCTLTSRNPSGQVFLNSVTMTAETDGWYSYTVNTAGQTEGLYRSQMCCTETTNYLCLDKSFYIGPSYLSAPEVEGAVWNSQTSSYTATGTFGKNLQNPVLTAAEIWGYTNRTLSGFGTLIADIWSYSTRSLTSFGTLIADIWKSEPSGQLTTAGTVGQTGYPIAENVTLETSNKNATASLKFGEGTVVFEITITNPSPLIVQKVPFVYYFPPEVKKEDIVKIDKKLITMANNRQVLGVSTINNTTLFVSGEVELPSLATRAYEIETKDIWLLPKEKIEALRTQAKDFLEPLKNTSYLAAATVLKSGIDVNLDKAISLQQNHLSPEQKIENYRQALTNFNLAEIKVDSLKTLAAQAKSTKSLLGFSGGVQLTSIGGLAFVLIAGFVFLLLYMRSRKKKEIKPEEPVTIIRENLFLDFFQKHKLKTLLIILILLGVILLGRLFSRYVSNKLPVVQKSIAPTTTVTPKATPASSLNFNDKIFVVVASGSSVRIHNQPLLQAETVYILKSTATVNKLQEVPDWIKIEIPADKISSTSAIVGWIAKEFTQELPK